MKTMIMAILTALLGFYSPDSAATSCPSAMTTQEPGMGRMEKSKIKKEKKPYYLVVDENGSASVEIRFPNEEPVSLWVSRKHMSGSRV